MFMSKIVKILFFGDIVGKVGRQAIVKELPKLKKKHRPDLVLANAENLAHGLGITPSIIEDMIEAGIDYFTSGNHVLDKPQGHEVLDELEPRVIRPANYKGKTPGVGQQIIKIKDYQILLINLMGRIFIDESFSNPFKTADKILKRYKKEKVNAILVDIHAEATSEKVALRHYLDGRVTALWGTHTHIQTADEEITDKGPAYITDVGMVGLADGVIGVDKENVIKNFLKGPDSSKNFVQKESGSAVINGIIIEIDRFRNMIFLDGILQNNQCFINIAYDLDIFICDNNFGVLQDVKERLDQIIQSNDNTCKAFHAKVEYNIFDKIKWDQHFRKATNDYKDLNGWNSPK